MELGALRLEFDLDNFLRVVPGAPGVGHEDGLEQAEERDGNQVADEEKRLEERKGEAGEKHGQEDVEHPALRVQRADLDYLLAVRHRRLLDPVEADISLDELDSAVRSGADGLRGRTSEPVDHGAAHHEAKEERRVAEA